jgi:hypothetical protein
MPGKPQMIDEYLKPLSPENRAARFGHVLLRGIGTAPRQKKEGSSCENQFLYHPGLLALAETFRDLAAIPSLYLRAYQCGLPISPQPATHL